MGISFLGWVISCFVADVLILSSKLLLFGADRVVAPSGSRQYLSVCRRDFPMQGDVTLKLGTVAKLL